MRLRLFAPLRDKVTSSAQPLVPLPVGPAKDRPINTNTTARRTRAFDHLVAAIRATGFMEYPASEAASLRLDAGEFDHLGPLFGFVGDQLSELSRRSRQRHAAEVSETGLHLEISKAGVYCLV